MSHIFSSYNRTTVNWRIVVEVIATLAMAAVLLFVLSGCTPELSRTSVFVTTTPIPTNTPDPTSTPTSNLTLEEALQRARDFDGSNADWTPYTETFNGALMALVPVGCFMMGSEDGDDDEQPVHQQCFDEPFWIDVYEVSNAQYGSTGFFRSSQPDQPRTGVDWFEARDFCAARGARLPTEREWEYAARGPDSLIYPWGNEFVAENVVYSANANENAEVGSRPGGASWVGALDLSGNVWEWVSTIYQPYPYDLGDGRESSSEDSSARGRRGGSHGFNSSMFGLRAANRGGVGPTSDHYIRGFRCARS